MEELIDTGKWRLFYAIYEDTGQAFKPFTDPEVVRNTLAEFNSTNPLCEEATFTLDGKMFRIVECKTVELREYLVTLLLIGKMN
jgi:hypothetical protein